MLDFLYGVTELIVKPIQHQRAE